MEDFKIMARLLSAIQIVEEKHMMDVSLFNEKVLKTTKEKRDSIAVQSLNR